MKFLLFLALLIITSSVFSQTKHYTFSELKGMEDNTGRTHLFYRLYFDYNENGIIFKENSIYHMDIFNNTDSLLLFDGGSDSPFSNPDFVMIKDVEFWNRNPGKYIFTGQSVVVDPVGFIQRYDKEIPAYSNLGEVFKGNIEISVQNDSLLFASVGNYFLKSTDGGISWNEKNSSYQLISLSPFNDSTIFVQDDEGLYISTNQGKDYFLVDTTSSDFYDFFYDRDEFHIYKIGNNGNEYFLSVSNNKGNPLSWTKRFTSNEGIFLSPDFYRSGEIYLGSGRSILYSDNYGADFELYRSFNRKLTGIYKKPSSDIIYAATEYDLYIVTADTVLNMKHLDPDPGIFDLYPLQTGNKWFYEKSVESQKSYFSIEVIKDTVIEDKLYYKSEYKDSASKHYIFERIDSSDGIIFRYYSGSDVPVYDFTSDEEGDTVYFKKNDNEIGWFLENRETFSRWGLDLIGSNYSAILSGSGYQLYTFVEDIGLYKKEGGEVLYSQTLLRGFIKDGIVYGDTSIIVDIKEEEHFPAEYSLSQNYPNPFNPVTKIRYSIPILETYRDASLPVKLKVYDILGNEVAILVNEVQPPGTYEIKFDTRNYDLSSGIYFYQLQTGIFNETKKLILLK